MGKTEISPRQLRVGEKLKHVLAVFMQSNKVIDPILEDKLITFSQILMSADLKIATCYFTVFGEADFDAVQTALNRHARYIKGCCSKELRHMKYIPDFRFRYDTSFDNFTKIDKLLSSPVIQRDIIDIKDKSQI